MDARPLHCAAARGPDGALWAPDGGLGRVWRITTSGNVTSIATGARTGPAGVTTGRDGGLRVIRGSSWKSSAVTELRLAYRDYGDGKRNDLGFRIARYAQ